LAGNWQIFITGIGDTFPKEKSISGSGFSGLADLPFDHSQNAADLHGHFRKQ
jgi:hypothetical protein